MRLPLYLAVVLVLAACAGQSTSYIRPATPIDHLSKTLVVEEPFEVVWDRLVKNLAADFFVINNIDKSSRLLNVSFTTTGGQEFVDCGHFTGSFHWGDSVKEKYDFPIASSSRHFEAATSEIVMEVSRKVHMEGRSNIYVAPTGEKTDVTVNVKYLVNVTEIRQRSLWNFVQQKIIPHPQVMPYSTTDTWSLTTSDPRLDEKPKCYATGKLESRILSYAK